MSEEENPIIWGWSTYPDEGFQGAHASKEEAIKEAREEVGEEVELFLQAGQYGDVTELGPNGHDLAENIIEGIGDSAGDEYGDLAEDWPHVPDGAEVLLAKALEKVVKDWMREHLKRPPGWQPVCDPETIAPLLVDNS